MEGGQFGQKTLGAFLVNKSVLLPRVELYHVKEEPLYFIMVLINPPTSSISWLNVLGSYFVRERGIWKADSLVKKL